MAELKTSRVKLTQVKVNKSNPRTITDAKFNKLIDSLLIFPKMMELRPIVVDDKMVALGGNMRTNALLHIAKEMSGEDIAARLSGIPDFSIRTEGERDILLGYWEAWKQAPTVYIIKASALSEDERRQFVIKDNVSFGQWDTEALSNWDSSKLDEWGLSDWNDTPIEPIDLGSFFEEDKNDPKGIKVTYCPHCGKDIFETPTSEEQSNVPASCRGL